MEKKELNLKELENVNGAGVKEFVEEFLGFFFGGVVDSTKNDVPHPHE